MRELIGAYGDAQKRYQNSEKGRKTQKLWRQNNPEKYQAIRKRSYAKLKEYYKKRQQSHKYRDFTREQKDRHNAYRRNRRNTNISLKIGHNLMRHLNSALKGHRKTSRALDLLGCPIDDFKLYLETKFEVGMTWKNYGRNGWHIDHIVPRSLFDLAKPEHQRVCFHFSNMQPMWQSDNAKKNNKFNGQVGLGI